MSNWRPPRLPVLFALALLLLTTMALRAADDGTDERSFASDLYSKLAESNAGNLFFSPSSIQAALGMAMSGARGKTATQMATALHLLNGEAKSASVPIPTGRKEYELATANAIWGQTGFSFLPDFLKSIKSDFGAGLFEVDFQGNREAARQKINSWVAKQTHDKIQDLIGRNVLSPATRLVLTNAIYFKGSWIDQFDEKRTQPEPFHMEDGSSKNTPMMHRTGNYGYAESADFQMVSLPYKGNDLSMVIVLPRDAKGLPKIEKEFSARFLADAKFQGRKVELSIPKFKLTSQFELSPVLKSMGMKDAFSNDADFSGMTGKRGFAISDVIHKAFVEVNETGTEAAAATAVVMVGSVALPQQNPVFRADHPFLFVIRDDKTGACLFMGRVSDPE